MFRNLTVWCFWNTCIQLIFISLAKSVFWITSIHTKNSPRQEICRSIWKVWRWTAWSSWPSRTQRGRGTGSRIGSNTSIRTDPKHIRTRRRERWSLIRGTIPISDAPSLPVSFVHVIRFGDLSCIAEIILKVLKVINKCWKN